MFIRKPPKSRHTRTETQRAGRHKRLESELRECRDTLEEIQHIAQIGSWQFDMPSRRAHWSDEISRIFEMAMPDLAEHDAFLVRIHHEDRQRVAAAYAETASNGASETIDYRLQFPDGRIKHVRERRTVKHDLSGRVLRVGGTVQDITECKLGDARLESEKMRLRAFIDAIPDMMWIKDTNGVYLAWNPVFERFNGLQASDIGGKSDLDLFDPVLAEHYRQTDLEVINIKGPRRYEITAVRAHDNCRVQLEAVKTLLFDENGNIAGVLGVARDITERKRMEEQLHLRKQEFRTIAENSPDPIARYNTECRCVYLNPALQNLIGMDPDFVLGKTPIEIALHRDLLCPYEEKVREALRTGKETELIFISDTLATGKQQICDHIRFIPEFDRDKRVVSILAIGRNISRFKEIERRLSRSGAMLRTLVARQEKEMEAERKRIAWGIHEELGQLLAALRFDLLTVQERPKDEQGTVQWPSKSAIRILDQALQIVRGLSTSVRPSVLDLGVEAALEWLADEFMRRTGIPCVLFLKSKMKLNEEEVIMLFRVTQDALDNIDRHAMAKSATIVFDTGTDHHTLTVKDDGKGFDPNQTPDGALGLLLIQERAATLGGAVTIDSALNKGTSLTIHIPVRAIEAA